MEIDSFCPVGIGGTCQLDTTNLKIFVGNLPLEYRSRDLFSIFISYGSIREAVVIPDRFRIRSRCYGFVTFVDEESVKKVFNSMPIESENRRLTIILACKNAKPRRAHFNVRHGTSGHRPLPPFNKEYNADKTNKRENFNGNNNENENNDENRNTNTNTNSKNGNHNVPKIYNDPSLFRTANIQPITPACIQISNDTSKKSTSKEIIKQEFPNEDIEKDFERSLRIKENKENNSKNENNNQILDYFQIKKENRKLNNPSKDMTMINNNATLSNQKISCRWQFALDNSDCQSNDTDKKYKNNEHCHYNNADNINGTTHKNKKTLNENVTWNRNMFNSRHGNKEQCTIMPHGKSVNSMHMSSIQQNNANVYSKQNNIPKSSLFENNYSQFFPASLSSAKIFDPTDSSCNDNGNNTTTITVTTAVTAPNSSNNVMSHSMLNELSLIKMVPSNPMISSYSGINQMGDSVSTMLSYRS